MLFQNVEILLRRVHERLLHLDFEVIKDPEHLLDKGWGVKGFDDVDDKNMMLAEFKKLCEQDPVHANLVFNVMTLAMLVDGKMSKRELGAFHLISSVAIFLN